MKVLVAGARGLVGRELCAELAKRKHVCLPGDLPECNVVWVHTLVSWSKGFEPDWVVNLAAFTQVDECEKNAHESFLANSVGALHMAYLAKEKSARLLQISTDYVFDGLGEDPLREDTPPFPLSVYGASKLAGEWAVKSFMPAERLLIVRGQSLYGHGRKSFPDAIRERARHSTSIPVVTDQVVSPTWAREFASGLVSLMERGADGVVHLSSSGHCSWNEFARAVLEEAGVTSARITDTTSTDLGRLAKRPAWSVFDLSRYQSLGLEPPSSWRKQLHEYAIDAGWAK